MKQAAEVIKNLNKLLAETEALANSPLTVSTIAQRNKVQLLQTQLIVDIACDVYGIHSSNIKTGGNDVSGT